MNDLIFPGICRFCGEEAEPCCKDGPACVAGLECRGDECTCPSETETYFASTLTNYKDYCIPVEEDTCTDFADTCLVDCQLVGTNLPELVANGTITCVGYLAFGWSNDADTSLINYAAYPFGSGVRDELEVASNFLREYVPRASGPDAVRHRRPRQQQLRRVGPGGHRHAGRVG